MDLSALWGWRVYLETKATNMEVELDRLTCRTHQLTDCSMLRKRVWQKIIEVGNMAGMHFK